MSARTKSPQELLCSTCANIDCKLNGFYSRHPEEASRFSREKGCASHSSMAGFWDKKPEPTIWEFVRENAIHVAFVILGGIIGFAVWCFVLPIIITRALP